MFLLFFAAVFSTSECRKIKTKNITELRENSNSRVITMLILTPIEKKNFPAKSSPPLQLSAKITVFRSFILKQELSEAAAVRKPQIPASRARRGHAWLAWRPAGLLKKSSGPRFKTRVAGGVAGGVFSE
jgi:hypothetical protein